MNSLELRYEVYKALHGRENVAEIKLDSPVPGEPISVSIKTWDPYDKVRSYKISVSED